MRGITINLSKMNLASCNHLVKFVKLVKVITGVVQPCSGGCTYLVDVTLERAKTGAKETRAMSLRIFAACPLIAAPAFNLG